MSSPSTTELLQQAAQALKTNDFAAGETLLGRVLTLDPDNLDGLNLHARVDLALGHIEQALAKAQKAANLHPIAPYVLTLAEALKASGNHQLAGKYFSKILAKLPHEPRALTGLGEIYEQAGYRRRAIDTYRVLLDLQPANLQIAVRYSNLMPIPELVEGMARVEAAKPDDAAPIQIRLSYFNHAVVYKEWAERARRNLMPYHATRLDELFFAYAATDRDTYESLADQVLTQKRDDRLALIAKAICVFSRNRRLEAEPYFQRIAAAKPDSIYDNIAFSDAFFQKLDRISLDDLEAGLPPLINVQDAAFSGSHVIYLSCNYGYFVDFARTMLLSIDAVAAAPQIHLHIMDGGEEDLAKVKAFCAGLTRSTVAVSAERTNLQGQGVMAQRCYYHAIRFIRLYRHLKAYGKTLWLMDVDALMHRDPAAMFAAMGETDAAFRVRPGRWEPWNQFNASVMAIAPTERGARYLGLVAAYVKHFHALGMLRWGIDQLAMYAAHEFLRDHDTAPALHLLDDRAVDYECFDDSFVWCNSGRGKFIQLKMLEKGVDASIDPERAKYFDALKVYAARLT